MDYHDSFAHYTICNEVLEQVLSNKIIFLATPPPFFQLSQIFFFLPPFRFEGIRHR